MKINFGNIEDTIIATATGTELIASDLWCQAFALSAVDFNFSDCFIVYLYKTSFDIMDIHAIKKVINSGAFCILREFKENIALNNILKPIIINTNAITIVTNNSIL